METSELITLITTILSSIILIGTLISRYTWAKEYKDAKEEVIRAKDEQINILHLRNESLKENNKAQIEMLQAQVSWLQVVDPQELINKYESNLLVLKDELSSKEILIYDKELLIHDYQKKQVENQNIFDSLEKANIFDKTIFETWADIIDVWAGMPTGTSIRTTNLSLDFALFNGVDEKEIKELEIGGLLHDIGKISIPISVLKKTSALTEDEWKIVKEHPIAGFNLLNKTKTLIKYAKFPLYHHEKWDGSGFPYGLKGNNIPSIVHLFSICDLYNALISDKPYRKAWGKDEIIKLLISGKGKQFSPKLINDFLNFINSTSENRIILSSSYHSTE